MSLQYTEKGKIQGDILVETSKEGFINKIGVELRDSAVCVLQQGQCDGWLFPLLDVKINEVFHLIRLSFA